MLEQALETDFCLEKRIAIAYDAIPYDEFLAVRILQEERNRKDRDDEEERKRHK